MKTAQVSETMTTTELAPSLKRGSQNWKILDRLRRARGGWVSLTKLVEASGSYAVATRVSNINDALWNVWDSTGRQDQRPILIENRTERDPNGNVRSFYRLIP